jgi:hypothetical protein
MKLLVFVFIFCLILVPFQAFAQVPDFTIGSYKTGEYPLFDQGGGLYSSYRIPTPLPGFVYSDSQPVCLYPIVGMYGGAYYSATSSSAISDDATFTSGSIDNMSSSPIVSNNSKTLSPCIPGYAYNLIPGSPDSDSCAILHPEGGGLLETAANVLSSVLPRTPEQFRIPTILANLGGQGSLAGNLALELYSGIWQYILIIVSIKFYQLIPGKFT